ncbi:MAG: dicarboxylate/amino acid:cation symporter [Bacteroidetes bacterium]|nr:MAG: dicarboxylate/amino acid:cation symporter [Bacteroidota bacterium]
MKKLALHWQIIIGMTAGVVFGLILSFSGNSTFSQDWIKPFGTIFINLLKMIAVPLVLVSLISGIASLKDVSKLSRIGSKTIGIYLGTTVLAVSLGLVVVNIIQPGKYFSTEQREKFKEQYANKATSAKEDAGKVKTQGPLQPIVDMFPSNVFQAATSNSDMLQVIIFAIMFGVALVLTKPESAEPVKLFFAGANDVMVGLVELIMNFAPLGVFALLSSLIVDFAGNDPAAALELFAALGLYSISVLIGLAMMVWVVYPLLLKTFANYSYKRFTKGMSPAQLLAFSTSSSAATLPVTMEQVEKELGVPHELCSFILPIGATVNMDGTSLYQAVATVFIAQAFGMDLGFQAQLGIVVTATLASIGSAAVPGAGMVMLVIVLEQAGIPLEGIALIFAVDRILDMCRTVVNVTGDACVAVIIAKTEGQLTE